MKTTAKYQFEQDQLECSNRYDGLRRDVTIDQLVPNRESITLIWYNPLLTESSTDISKISNFRHHNNYILLYTKKELVIEYLASNIKKGDHIIVVLYGVELFDKVYECKQVHTILIVDSNSKSKFNTIEHHSKTVSVFEESDLLMIELEEVIKNVECQVNYEIDGMFSTLNQKEVSLRDLQHALGSSIWCQVFKVMVKAMPHSIDAQQQMLDECRSYYHGNPLVLKSIDDFEENYKAEDAIKWYTKPGFLYKIINKALRTEDVVALYTFRYFITDLSVSLEAARTEQMARCVYRGSLVSRDEVEKYQAGYFVATNAFLSASCDKKVAKIFAGVEDTNTSVPRNRDNKVHHALFEIIIKPDHLSDIVLADISSLSEFRQESEILFDMGTTFEIISSIYDDTNHVWNIQLQTSAKAIPTYRDYIKYIETLMKETNADILFGILLTDMGEYTKTYEYFDRLLARMSDDHEDRANVYYGLSRAHRFKGEYTTALELLHKAERLQRAKSPDSDFDLARTLAGIGSLYYELHKHEEELLYYQNAIAIYEKILPSDHIEMARSLNRLGYAYLNQQCYIEALDYLTKALNTYRRIVPNGHPGIGQTLLNLGMVHHGLGHMQEALDFYQEALKLTQETLPEDHLHLVLFYYQLGVYHEEQQQLDLALKYAQQASKIAEIKLSPEKELRCKVQDLVKRLINKSI